MFGIDFNRFFTNFRVTDAGRVGQGTTERKLKTTNTTEQTDVLDGNILCFRCLFHCGGGGGGGGGRRGGRLASWWRHHLDGRGE